MTRPDSDGERPGWRIRRAKPSATRPLIVLLVLAAVIFGGAGYLLGNAGKDGTQREVVAPAATAPPAATALSIATPQFTPVSPAATRAPLPTSVVTPPASSTAISGNSGGSTTPPNRNTPEAAPSPRSVATMTPGQTTYVVVLNDSLSSIAEKQGIAPADRDGWFQKVRSLNNLAGDNIAAGQQLTLPPLS